MEACKIWTPNQFCVDPKYSVTNAFQWVFLGKLYCKAWLWRHVKFGHRISFVLIPTTY